MQFINELGSEIDVEVSKKDINDIEGVLISISGPTSDTEVHVTRQEALVIYDRLGLVVHEDMSDQAGD